MERVVLEDLEDCENRLRPVSQHSEGLFSASLEYALRARDAQSVDHVGRQTEGHSLRLWQQFALYHGSDEYDAS